MGRYAIGDIQGCHDSFMALLDRIGFRPGADRLWLAGDLVNRGPRSADVVRWVRDHREDVVAVLGNHDLHVLARAEGLVPRKKRDTSSALLDDPELLDFLADLPLLHRDGEHLMVHAGLLPAWTTDEALARARRAEERLRTDRRGFLNAIRSRRHAPEPLEPLTPEWQAIREDVAVLTRIRLVNEAGRPDEGFTGPPEEAPPGQIPWYGAPNRRSRDVTVLFGHWAALGHRVVDRAVGLDSGCVWGGSLTAYRLEDGAVFSVPCSPSE